MRKISMTWYPVLGKKILIGIMNVDIYICLQTKMRKHPRHISSYACTRWNDIKPWLVITESDLIARIRAACTFVETTCTVRPSKVRVCMLQYAIDILSTFRRKHIQIPMFMIPIQIFYWTGYDVIHPLHFSMHYYCIWKLWVVHFFEYTLCTASEVSRCAQFGQSLCETLYKIKLFHTDSTTDEQIKKLVYYVMFLIFHFIHKLVNGK